MLISTKGTYALRVLTDMAKHDGEDNYICILDISKRLNISRKYLESIMTLLAKNNLIESKRGITGGYKLIKKPVEYTLYEILIITEDNLAPVPCLKEEKTCKDQELCPTLNTFKGLHEVIKDYLLNKSLEDLMGSNNC